jgi:hypothetical protein
MALVPERYPVTYADVCRSFEQWIFHAGGLLLHCGQRLPNFDRTHAPRAQVPHFFNLEQIEERVALGGRNKLALLPRHQLVRADAENANQILSSVSVHGCKPSDIIGSLLLHCK